MLFGGMLKVSNGYLGCFLIAATPERIIKESPVNLSLKTQPCYLLASHDRNVGFCVDFHARCNQLHAYVPRYVRMCMCDVTDAHKYSGFSPLRDILARIDHPLKL